MCIKKCYRTLNFMFKSKYRVSQKKRILRNDWMIFSKPVLNSKISCISTTLKEVISNINLIAKKLQSRQYFQNRLQQLAMCKKASFLG